MKTADAEDFQASLNNLFMVSYCLKLRLIVKSAVRMTYGFFLFCYQYFIAKDEENVSEKKLATFLCSPNLELNCAETHAS